VRKIAFNNLNYCRNINGHGMNQAIETQWTTIEYIPEPFLR